MDLDTSKIDDAVLALLYLGMHDGARAWKGFDWDAMDRLHRAGLISDPRGAAKSVVFTETGLERAARLLGTCSAGPPGRPRHPAAVHDSYPGRPPRRCPAAAGLAIPPASEGPAEP